MRRSLVLGVLVAAWATPGLCAEKADRIFINGRIWTGDAARPRVEALAVRGTVVMAAGSTAEIRNLAEKKTDVVDLKGRLVVPGFNDAHVHFMEGSLASLVLDEAATLAEVQRLVGAWARANPERPWVVGRGWAYSAFRGGLPHKTQLDEAVADRPAWMTSYDGHTGWANSMALREAGLDRDAKDPAGGVIVRDGRGEPTGVLEGAAMALVGRRVPAASPEEKYRALKKGIERAASFGLTSVQDAGFDEEDFAIYERLLAEGALTLRFSFALPFLKDPSAETMSRYRELRRKHAGPRLRVAAVKGYLDGVVETRTAAMNEPYAGGGLGLALWSPEDLNRTAAFYDREGFQILLHAVGDRAIGMALSAYDFAGKANGPGPRRHRIEHVEVPRLADLPRFKVLGVVASTQALFAEPNANHLSVYVPTLGPERASRAMAFRAIDDAGAVQAFGSDWPVFSCDVLRGIYCAVTRTTPAGTPPGGWEPSQRLAVEAALRHFTRDAAYASQEENLKGTLAAGQRADLVVLSDDILTAPPERLLQTRVLLTVLGGQDTYRAREF